MRGKNWPEILIGGGTKNRRDYIPAKVPVSSRLSLVHVWQQLLTYLLDHHYGLTLNDIPFHDDAAIEEHIDAGITLADAVSFLVDRYELVRITERDSLGRSGRRT